METRFYILITLKALDGMESIGKFYVGDNRDYAYALFEKLNGADEISEKDVLFLDFMETVDSLPYNLKMKSCTLNLLGENCKTITKELFRLNNLEKA